MADIILQEGGRIARLSKIVQELKTITSIPDLKEIRDKAAAIQDFLKTSGLGLEAQNDGAEIKLWAERRIGEILAESINHNGGPKCQGLHDVSVKELGLSWSQSSRFQKHAKIPEDLYRGQIAKIRENDKELTSAVMLRLAKELERQEKKEQNEKLVAGVADPREVLRDKYPTIVIDPPWDWGDEGDVSQFGRGDPTYATMSLAQLLEYPVGDLAEGNAHIYLWITNRSLPKGFQLLERWGFRYVTMLTWCKPSIGMGNYFRGSTEQILFGVRGKLSLLRNDMGTWFTAERPGRHSAKPEEFYQMVESCSPGPWLELFQRKARNGWACHGAEVQGGDAA